MLYFEQCKRIPPVHSRSCLPAARTAVYCAAGQPMEPTLATDVRDVNVFVVMYWH